MMVNDQRNDNYDRLAGGTLSKRGPKNESDTTHLPIGILIRSLKLQQTSNKQSVVFPFSPTRAPPRDPREDRGILITKLATPSMPGGTIYS